MKTTLKKRILDGDFLIGLAVNVPSPALVELSGYAGFDYVQIDAEHGAIDISACEELVRAAESVGIEPIVRVPTNTLIEIQRYLDTGAIGVQIPQVNTIEEAEQAVSSAHYYPIGYRGLAGGRAAHFSIDRTLIEHIERSKNTIVIAQIENVDAISNLDAIFNLEHVDVFFVGPADLSQSLGIPGQTQAPKTTELIDKILDKAKAHNKPLAKPVTSVKAARAAREAGYQIVAVTAMGLFGHAAHSFLEEARS
jgi:4-hydroxy-2-oxoheptanedioate aldolase